MMQPLLHAADAFRGINLGDVRLTRRLLASVKSLQSDPAQSFPNALRQPAQLEGFYRLIGNDRVGHDSLVDHLAADAWSRTSNAETVGAVVVAHDTTEYAFSCEAPREGLMKLGRRQGFYGHHAIAVAETGPPIVFGAVGLHAYIQRDRKWQRITGSDDEVPLDIGSDRWFKLVEEVEEARPRELDVVHVMDREGDIFALMAEMDEQDAQFVVRSRYDRPADGDGIKLSEVLACEPVVAKREVPLTTRTNHNRPPEARKRHPARHGRTATLSIRFGIVELQQPRRARLEGTGSLGVTVIDVSEAKPPEGTPGVHWRLLTNLEVVTPEDALRIVDIYRRRWLIEEFFKAVKTGCGYLKRQANTRRSLLDTLAVLLPLAVSLLNLRAVSRTTPKASWATVLTPLQLRVLQQARPKHRITKRSNARTVMLAIAEMGGHLKSNGDPGWKTLGAGMEHLLALEEGWKAAIASVQSGGDIQG